MYRCKRYANRRNRGFAEVFARMRILDEHGFPAIARIFAVRGLPKRSSPSIGHLFLKRPGWMFRPFSRAGFSNERPEALPAGHIDPWFRHCVKTPFLFNCPWLQPGVVSQENEGFSQMIKRKIPYCFSKNGDKARRLEDPFNLHLKVEAIDRSILRNCANGFDTCSEDRG